MNTGLSKSRLMDWRQCPRKLWLKTHRPELTHYNTDTENRFRFGYDIGEQARALYPKGLLIDAPDVTVALNQTLTALREHPDRPLFEAAFAHDGVLVRVDVLVPTTNGHYQLIEVKASTGTKDHYIADAAIQAWVVQHTVPLSGVTLAHINNQFIYGGDGDYRGLLTFVPIDADLASLLTEIPSWITTARTLLSGVEPDIMPGEQCTQPYTCPFEAHCGDDEPQPDYPLHQIPRLSDSRLQALRELGVRDIREIPDDFSLTQSQQRIVDVIQTGRVELKDETVETVTALPYPRFYLDFETTQCAIPPWAGTCPYQQLPVQWSCHVELCPGNVISQRFLYERQEHPMRAFAEALILAVQEPCEIELSRSTQSCMMDAVFADYPEIPHNGPILVYNATFEKRILAELAQALPDLAPALNGINKRIVNLLPIVREHYYHPSMKGSWSLKSVLPTMAPHLSYELLGIADGGEASSAWQELLHPQTPLERCDELRDALIDYCGLDTWALLKMVHFLSKPSEQSQSPLKK